MKKLMKKRYTLAIDPSINFLGWAIFDKKKLIKYGLLQPKLRDSDYLIKCREMVCNLWKVIHENVEIDEGFTLFERDYELANILQIVTEIPDHFATAGYMSRESGAVQKLTFLAGMIYNMAPDVIGYFPRVWKGNLKKHVCALRLTKLSSHYKEIMIGKKPVIEYCKDCKVSHYKIVLRHDIIDAIGIGTKFLLGKI